MNEATKSLLAVIVAGVLSGCAIPGAELDVPIKKTAVPPTKMAVAIKNVSDKRQFVIKPSSASMPSVAGDDVWDTDRTARALGRNRATYGHAGGNFDLPKGKKVSGLVENILAAALAEKGYAVIPKGAAGYETALPVSAEIQKFWMWLNPGGAARITFESEVLLTGPWPVAAHSRVVRGQATYSSYISIGNRDWADLLKNGVTDLQRNTEAVLQ